MIKMFFQLMAPGKTNYVVIANRVMRLPDGVTWNVPYFSRAQYVVGNDEESCLVKAREKLNKKYVGFRVIRIEQI